jgi:hypothetical protein
MSWQNPGNASVSIKQIARAGHFLQQERADEVNALLLDWLDGHEAARPDTWRPRLSCHRLSRPYKTCPGTPGNTLFMRLTRQGKHL